MPRTRRMFPRDKKRKLLQRQQSWAHVILNFLNIWTIHAPICLHGTIMDWVQKEKENQFAPPPVQLNF
uniref:Uncharacterized protein n=1 Tax=Arundo donax TaxID=35708 RepID=A0A0A9BWG9_ARUDO